MVLNFIRTIIFTIVIFIVFGLIWIPLNFGLYYCAEGLESLKGTEWWFFAIFFLFMIGAQLIHGIIVAIGILLGHLFRFTLKIGRSVSAMAFITFRQLLLKKTQLIYDIFLQYNSSLTSWIEKMEPEKAFKHGVKKSLIHCNRSDHFLGLMI